jgi:CheY-like chemotaxis protein
MTHAETKPVPNATILLVDDDEDFLLQNEIRLREMGYRVLSATSQKAAKSTFASNTPDLVVLDLMMEDKDAGIVLAHHFKKQNPMLPILLVTGVAREAGMEFGAVTSEDRNWIKANKVLPKPIRFEQLRREIEILLANR